MATLRPTQRKSRKNLVPPSTCSGWRKTEFPCVPAQTLNFWRGNVELNAHRKCSQWCIDSSDLEFCERQCGINVVMYCLIMRLFLCMRRQGGKYRHVLGPRKIVYRKSLLFHYCSNLSIYDLIVEIHGCPWVYIHWCTFSYWQYHMNTETLDVNVISPPCLCQYLLHALFLFCGCQLNFFSLFLAAPSNCREWYCKDLQGLNLAPDHGMGEGLLLGCQPPGGAWWYSETIVGFLHKSIESPA